jgi:hypothetical protein
VYVCACTSELIESIVKRMAIEQEEDTFTNLNEMLPSLLPTYSTLQIRRTSAYLLAGLRIAC